MNTARTSGILMLLQGLKRMLHMDLRALALARVCLAVAILADLEQKFRYLGALYTDSGILPRAGITTFFNQPYFFSLHMASGEAWFQAILFALAALLALSLLFGYKTKTVTILSWGILISLQARNLVILNAGDAILRLMLFWGMFLPLGAMWSVDHAMTPDEGKPKDMQYFSAGTVGWILQIVMIYWVTVYLRQSPEWLSEGSALYYALRIDQITTGFGYWLSLQPLVILQVLTWCSVAIECTAPLLLLIGDKRGIARFLGVVLGVTFHFGIFLMMHIGVFPFICMIGWIAMLPTGFWNSMQRWFAYGRTGEHITLYYDQNCGFCLKVTHLLRTFLGLSQTKILPAQDTPEIQTIMEREHSWVVQRSSGEQYIRWEGICVAVSASPLFFWLAPLMECRPMRFVGNRIYNWVASHRMQLGKLTRVLQWRQASLAPGKVATVFACCAILLGVTWNLHVMRVITHIPAPVEAATLLLRLDQYWNMFAPYPLKDDGWYVIPGTLVNGMEIDLQTDKVGVSFDKPTALGASFPTESWRKFFLNLWLKDYEKYREFYAEYHCKRWNSTHAGDDRLKTIFIHFMRETTPHPSLRGQERAEKMTIWEWHCGGIT